MDRGSLLLGEGVFHFIPGSTGEAAERSGGKGRVPSFLSLSQRPQVPPFKAGLLEKSLGNNQVLATQV